MKSPLRDARVKVLLQVNLLRYKKPLEKWRRTE